MHVGYHAQYFEKDGTPWLPAMGEMHYSRTDRNRWRRTLLTMKACGIEIVSTYVMWIHHEEIRGRYDFSGNKDLRAFVKEVQSVGMSLFLRIGPWVHGEVRNGGFPDWLFDEAAEKGFSLRRSDPGYLSLVEGFFSKLYEQVDGLFARDGGPIIGIQIENEYTEGCGGIPAPEGDAHIRDLTELAHRIGFRAPIETATGWGNAGTGDLVRVWGGYPASPWMSTTEELPPSENYLFSENRNDANIGADALQRRSADAGGEVGAPYITAELGGGCQITDRRRPLLSGRDISALALAKLGSGVNLLGFYMFCGGTNPCGVLTTMEETNNREGVAGCGCILPKYGYDFQAPIGEFGQLHESYAELRMLLLMLRDFGKELCTMRTVLPEVGPRDACDTETLRTAFRGRGNSGFLFVNNYVRRTHMAAHRGITLTAGTEGGPVTFPPVDIEDGQFFIWPVNLPIKDGVLRLATATPLCSLNGDTYLFYGEREPVFEFAKKPDGVKILLLDRKDALRAQKVTTDREHCILTDATVLEDEGRLTVLSTERPTLRVYPDFPKAPKGYRKAGTDGDFTVYEKERYETLTVGTEITCIGESDEKKTYRVRLTYPKTLPDDVFLDLVYAGNDISVFAGQQPVTDNYYNGAPCTVGLARCGFPQELTVEIGTLKADKAVYLQIDPRKDGKDVAVLTAARPTVQQAEVLVF